MIITSVKGYDFTLLTKRKRTVNSGSSDVNVTTLIKFHFPLFFTRNTK